MLQEDNSLQYLCVWVGAERIYLRLKDERLMVKDNLVLKDELETALIAGHQQSASKRHLDNPSTTGNFFFNYFYLCLNCTTFKTFVSDYIAQLI